MLVPLKEKGGSEEGWGLKARKRVRDKGRGRNRGVRSEVEEEASDSNAVTGYPIAFRRNTLPLVQETEAVHFFPLVFYLALI